MKSNNTTIMPQANEKNKALVIYKASAGSGKTYALVKEYLRLSFSVPETKLQERFKHILAITFTNKAVNEMKSRILVELNKIINEFEKSDMGKDLCKELNFSQSKLQRYAQLVLSAILHNYSEFSVCTIDSFMSRIVRTFAYELDLPLQFDISIDQDEMITAIVDRLLSIPSSQDKSGLTSFLVHYYESEMLNDVAYSNVEHSLNKLAKELFQEKALPHIESLKEISLQQFQEIYNNYTTQNSETLKSIARLGKKTVALIENNGLELTVFSGRTNGIGMFFKKLSLGELPKVGAHVTHFVNRRAFVPRATTQPIRDKVMSISEQLIDNFNEFVSLKAQIATRKMVQKNLHVIALMNQMKQIKNEIDIAENTVQLSDCNERIAEVVNSEPIPFIYERVGNRYYNILIDEFQDTSCMQWANLIPLIENGISNSGGIISDPSLARTLIVGDSKQAIYRFKNGDVKQFIRLPKVDPNFSHGDKFNDNSYSRPLPFNRRSGATIVNFNNRLYQWIVTDDRYKKEGKDENKDNNDKNRKVSNDHKLIYADSHQTPIHDGGYIEFGQYGLSLSRTEQESAMIEAIRQGVIHQHQLGYPYKDILVLARNKKILSKISIDLQQHDIPAVSNESFFLSNSKVVRILVDTLHYMDCPNNAAAMRVLKLLTDLGKITDTSIYINDIVQSQYVNFYQLLRKCGFNLNVTLLRSKTLYDCCESLIRDFELEGIDMAYVATFLNQIVKYSRQSSQDLHQFVEFLDNHFEEMTTQTSEESDAIRLMTIHKSKGLEAKVVIYALPAPFNKTSNIWVDYNQDNLPTALINPTLNEESYFTPQIMDEYKDMEIDNDNLLYVATTRPEDKLLIYSVPIAQDSSSYIQSHGLLLRDFIAYDRINNSENNWKESSTTDSTIYHLGNDNPFIIPTSKDKVVKKPTGVTISKLCYNSISRISNKHHSPKSVAQELAIEYGNMMHDLFSLVKNVNDIDTAIAKFARDNDLSSEQSAYLLQELQSIIADETVQPFFATTNTVLNEHDISYQGEICRPDRIVFAGDQTWVVDYKTGTPNPEYHTQVSKYCNAVREMGYPNVSGYLLFIQQGSKPYVEQI